MKNLLKIFALAIILTGFATSASAQGVTINSSASAVIVQTITMAKLQDLHFGDLAVTTLAGTCVLTPMAGIPTRAVTGGVTLPASIGVPLAAQFNVTGAAGQNYIITIPQNDLIITHSGGSATMIVKTYTTNQTILTPSTWQAALSAPGGTSTFYVGGTCEVGANQLAGFYTNLVGFPVTVNYQ